MGEAYQSGLEAALCGANNSNNPYPIDSAEGREWFRGLTDRLEEMDVEEMGDD
jgi:hypothetical protein